MPPATDGSSSAPPSAPATDDRSGQSSGAEAGGSSGGGSTEAAGEDQGSSGTSEASAAGSSAAAPSEGSSGSEASSGGGGKLPGWAIALIVVGSVAVVAAAVGLLAGRRLYSKWQVGSWGMERCAAVHTADAWGRNTHVVAACHCVGWFWHSVAPSVCDSVAASACNRYIT